MYLTTSWSYCQHNDAHCLSPPISLCATCLSKSKSREFQLRHDSSILRNRAGRFCTVAFCLREQTGPAIRQRCQSRSFDVAITSINGSVLCSRPVILGRGLGRGMTSMSPFLLFLNTVLQSLSRTLVPRLEPASQSAIVCRHHYSRLPMSKNLSLYMQGNCRRFGSANVQYCLVVLNFVNPSPDCHVIPLGNM